MSDMQAERGEGHLSRSNRLPEKYDHDSNVFHSPLQEATLEKLRAEKTTHDHIATFFDFQSIVNAEVLDIQDQGNKFLKEEANPDMLRTFGFFQQAQQYFQQHTDQKTEISGETFEKDMLNSHPFNILQPFETKAKELKELQHYIHNMVTGEENPLEESVHQQRVKSLKNYLTHQKSRWGALEDDAANDYWVIFDQLQTSLHKYAEDQNFFSKHFANPKSTLP